MIATRTNMKMNLNIARADTLPEIFQAAHHTTETRVNLLADQAEAMALTGAAQIIHLVVAQVAGQAHIQTAVEKAAHKEAANHQIAN